MDFFPFIQSFVTSVFVLLSFSSTYAPRSPLSFSSDSCTTIIIRYYFMCVCAHTLMWVYQLLSFLFTPLPKCLMYSFFKYLLTTYYVSDVILGTRAIGAKQTFLFSYHHRLSIQISYGQHRKGIQ